MRTFKQNKLWREKLIEQRKQEGSAFHMRELDDTAYDQQLRHKLAEETEEVCTAQSRIDLIEELGDVFEVIDTLCVLHGITRDEIIATQTKKRQERGGFTQYCFVETVSLPQDCAAAKYFLAQPDKYPEVK